MYHYLYQALLDQRDDGILKSWQPSIGWAFWPRTRVKQASEDDLARRAIGRNYDLAKICLLVKLIVPKSETSRDRQGKGSVYMYLFDLAASVTRRLQEQRDGSPGFLSRSGFVGIELTACKLTPGASQAMSTHTLLWGSFGQHSMRWHRLRAKETGERAPASIATLSSSVLRHNTDHHDRTSPRLPLRLQCFSWTTCVPAST